jgi:hypothetical protein
MIRALLKKGHPGRVALALARGVETVGCYCPSAQWA